MNNQDNYAVFEKQELCIQEEAPYCNDGCPLGVDVRAMIRQISGDKLEAAYSEYRKRVIFAQILSRICTAPCQAGCLRKEYGDPIQIRMLEKACADYGGAKAPAKGFIRPKDGVVHIVGASLGGLACANTLARKGFTVHLYEKTDRLGGSLWEYPEHQLEREVIEKDISQNLNFERIHIHLEYHVTNDTVFEEGEVFNACSEELSFSGASKVFVLKDYLNEINSPVHVIMAGKQAATHIEQAIKGEPLAAPPVRVPTRLVVPDPDVGQDSEAILPENGENYTRAEAIREAARCIQCQCMACTKSCLLLKSNKGYPKVYINHAQQSLRTINLIHRKLAARRTNACNLCGLCGEVCPNGLDMGEVYMKSRRIMHANAQLPEAFHEFWLRDMAFSTSDEVSLCRQQSGYNTSAYLFFPGCQMGGSLPEYVSDTYRHLCTSLEGGVALCVDCCGAPSEWAGYPELTQPMIQRFHTSWEELGRPKVILACPSCEKIFSRYHPDIPTVSLWSVLEVKPDQKNLPCEDKRVAVFDPCSSRNNPAEQQSIRRMLKAMGYCVEELPKHGQYAQCCGYGGLIYASNPELAGDIRSDRILDSALPYVTYCVNCREVFASGGKKVWHILDLMFGGEDRAGQKPPDWSSRRANRIRLKKELLQEFWGEAMQRNSEPFEDIKLTIPEELGERMEKELIMADDIRQVVFHAEGTNEKLIYENGHFLAHLRVGHNTYWAEYQPWEGGFLLHNAYTHRMRIKEVGDG